MGRLSDLDHHREMQQRDLERMRAIERYEQEHGRADVDNMPPYDEPDPIVLRPGEYRW